MFKTISGGVSLDSFIILSIVELQCSVFFSIWVFRFLFKRYRLMIFFCNYENALTWGHRSPPTNEIWIGFQDSYVLCLLYLHLNVCFERPIKSERHTSYFPFVFVWRRSNCIKREIALCSDASTCWKQASLQQWQPLKWFYCIWAVTQ